jgi:hypothetical protein
VFTTTGVGSTPFGFVFDRCGGCCWPKRARTRWSPGFWIVVTGEFVYTANVGSAMITGYRMGAVGGAADRQHARRVPAQSTSARRRTAGSLRTDRGAGGVDAFRVGADGSLTRSGTSSWQGAACGEGIAVL